MDVAGQLVFDFLFESHQLRRGEVPQSLADFILAGFDSPHSCRPWVVKRAVKLGFEENRCSAEINWRELEFVRSRPFGIVVGSA